MKPRINFENPPPWWCRWRDMWLILTGRWSLRLAWQDGALEEAAWWSAGVDAYKAQLAARRSNKENW
jgi:hypothetical protein